MLHTQGKWLYDAGVQLDDSMILVAIMFALQHVCNADQIYSSITFDYDDEKQVIKTYKLIQTTL